MDQKGSKITAVRHDAELKKRFADALLGCACIKDRDTRDQIVAELETLDIRFIERNSKNSFADVLNIVNRCLNFENGIAFLTDWVLYFESPSLPMKSVFKLLP